VSAKRQRLPYWRLSTLILIIVITALLSWQELQDIRRKASVLKFQSARSSDTTAELEEEIDWYRREHAEARSSREQIKQDVRSLAAAMSQWAQESKKGFIEGCTEDLLDPTHRASLETDYTLSLRIASMSAAKMKPGPERAARKHKIKDAMDLLSASVSIVDLSEEQARETCISLFEVVESGYDSLKTIE